jgi:putative tryptophan/tyrosine transport system substrate-binding protein
MQFHRWKRREFVALLGGAAAAWPMAAHAQRSGAPRVGFLHAASPAQFSDTAFLQGLREGGFIEGQNVTFEYRWARGAYERLPSLAAELVELRVDLLAAFGTPAVRVAKSATAKSAPAIPVVFAMGSDPVADGLVESLSRPGGNMTGTTSVSGALAPKRLELMREFLRDDAPIGILINPANPLSEAERRDAAAAAGSIGQRLEVFTASNQAQIDQAFAALKPRNVSVLMIAVDTFYYTQMQRMATLAAQARVPVIGPLREFAVEGGLLSYGTNIADGVRQAGVMAAKVLKGAKPAELPVQQPTKFELVVNMTTAKSLGIELSPKLLALADEVIE